MDLTSSIYLDLRTAKNTVFFDIFYLRLRFGNCPPQKSSRGVPPGGGIGGLDLKCCQNLERVSNLRFPGD